MIKYMCKFNSCSIGIKLIHIYVIPTNHFFFTIISFKVTTTLNQSQFTKKVESSDPQKKSMIITIEDQI